MKKICGLLVAAVLLLTYSSNGQLVTMAGSFVTADTTSTIVLNNIGLANHATGAQFENIFKFTGEGDAMLGGSEAMRFSKIILEKGTNSKLVLNRDVTIERSLSFFGGLVDLNNKTMYLAPSATLANENKASRMTGARGGVVLIRENVSSSVANPGNLGAVISSSKSIGEVTVKRGHKAQSGVSMDGSIERYYDIHFERKDLGRVRLTLDHLEPELNGQEESRIKVHESADQGIHWNEPADAAHSTVTLEVGEKTNSSRWTLANTDELKPESLGAILKTWPNPATSYFYVQAESAGDVGVQVFDLSGKLQRLYTTKNGSAIRVENLSPGVYVIKANGPNFNKSVRVVVLDKNVNQAPALFKTPYSKAN